MTPQVDNGDMREPIFQIEVSEDINHRWHADNINACEQYVKEVKAENAERLGRAQTNLAEAIEWARREGYPA